MVLKTSRGYIFWLVYCIRGEVMGQDGRGGQCLFWVPYHSTNSEAWVMTDFSVTVVQIKKTLTKKRSYIQLCVRPGCVQLPKKYPVFLGGVSKFLSIHIRCALLKYNFGCIFKISWRLSQIWPQIWCVAKKPMTEMITLPYNAWKSVECAGKPYFHDFGKETSLLTSTWELVRNRYYKFIIIVDLLQLESILR